MSQRASLPLAMSFRTISHEMSPLYSRVRRRPEFARGIVRDCAVNGTHLQYSQLQHRSRLYRVLVHACSNTVRIISTVECSIAWNFTVWLWVIVLTLYGCTVQSSTVPPVISLTVHDGSSTVWSIVHSSAISAEIYRDSYDFGNSIFF